MQFVITLTNCSLLSRFFYKKYLAVLDAIEGGGHGGSFVCGLAALKSCKGPILALWPPHGNAHGRMGWFYQSGRMEKGGGRAPAHAGLGRDALRYQRGRPGAGGPYAARLAG